MAANNVRTLATAWNDERSELIGVLPREVGVLLIVAGVGGILLPGPVGSPFLLLGAVTLWPRLFTRLEICVPEAVPENAPHGYPADQAFPGRPGSALSHA